MVVNMECAVSAETYLHRIGRAGRYGGRASVFTILATAEELSRFSGMVKHNSLKVKKFDIDGIYPTQLTPEFYDKSEDFLV